jgi:hypothetical protein
MNTAPTGFDMQSFAQSIDPAQFTRTLKIGGKDIEVPKDAQVNLSTSGPFIRLKVGQVEHRELQLAGESRVLFSERLYDTAGNLIAEFKSDTGWAVSSAPRLDLIPKKMRAQ